MTLCLSPSGPNIYSTPALSQQLIVGTANGVATLERTDPGRWAAVRRGLEGELVNSVLLEPRHGGLFAALTNGLYASSDEGQTWETRMRGLTEDYVFSLACVEREGAVVLFAGTQPAHLFQSTDYGETWEELPALAAARTDDWKFPGGNPAHVKDIIFDSRDNRRMYVGVEQGGVYRTEDAGKSWSELVGYEDKNDWNYKDIHRVTLNPFNPDEVYIATGEGLYASPDRGATWESRQPPSGRLAYALSVAVAPTDPQVVFVAGDRRHPGMWRDNPDADGGVLRSRDGGHTWEPIMRGLPEHMYESVEALSVNAWDDGYALFLGTTEGELFESQNEGESWSMIASGIGPVSKGTHYQRANRTAGQEAQKEKE